VHRAYGCRRRAHARALTRALAPTLRLAARTTSAGNVRARARARTLAKVRGGDLSVDNTRETRTRAIPYRV